MPKVFFRWSSAVTWLRLPASVRLNRPSFESLGRFNTRCKDKLNRPGSDGGSQSMEDESHGGTKEVQRRAA
jgi:hypothetical protein